MAMVRLNLRPTDVEMAQLQRRKALRHRVATDMMRQRGSWNSANQNVRSKNSHLQKPRQMHIQGPLEILKNQSGLLRRQAPLWGL